MSQPVKPNKRWFSGSQMSFASTNVDKEAGIIRNVILCQVGEAKGHGVHLEQSFIDDLNSYAQKYHQKGMKCRFGHPSMSTDALGSEAGRFHNFSVDGSRIRADLHLYNSSNFSPTHPQIKDWLLSMAEEDSDAIMCSIVFKVKGHYQRNDKGERFDIKYVFDGWDGHWESKDKKNKFDPKGKIYVDLSEFLFTDIVDQGAATDKLFSAQFNRDKFSVIATEFLNEHPEIDSFLSENPEKLTEFLNKRKSNYSEESESTPDTNSSNTNMKIDMSKYPNALKAFGVESMESDDSGVSLQVEHLDSLEQALSDGASATKQVGTLTAEKTNLETQLKAEEAKVKNLTTEKENLESENKNFKENYVPAPGAAANAEDGGDQKNEFYSEADAELERVSKINEI